MTDYNDAEGLAQSWRNFSTLSSTPGDALLTTEELNFLDSMLLDWLQLDTHGSQLEFAAKKTEIFNWVAKLRDNAVSMVASASTQLVVAKAAERDSLRAELERVKAELATVEAESARRLSALLTLVSDEVTEEEAMELRNLASRKADSEAMVDGRPFSPGWFRVYAAELIRLARRNHKPIWAPVDLPELARQHGWAVAESDSGKVVIRNRGPFTVPEGIRTVNISARCGGASIEVHAPAGCTVHAHAEGGGARVVVHGSVAYARASGGGSHVVCHPVAPAGDSTDGERECLRQISAECAVGRNWAGDRAGTTNAEEYTGDELRAGVDKAMARSVPFTLPLTDEQRDELALLAFATLNSYGQDAKSRFVNVRHFWLPVIDALAPRIARVGLRELTDAECGKALLESSVTTTGHATGALSTLGGVTIDAAHFASIILAAAQNTGEFATPQNAELPPIGPRGRKLTDGERCELGSAVLDYRCADDTASAALERVFMLVEALLAPTGEVRVALGSIRLTKNAGWMTENGPSDERYPFAKTTEATLTRALSASPGDRFEFDVCARRVK
jgi:hypothetical protein